MTTPTLQRLEMIRAENQSFGEYGAIRAARFAFKVRQMLTPPKPFTVSRIKK